MNAGAVREQQRNEKRSKRTRETLNIERKENRRVEWSFFRALKI
jgi:hypothetical protein